MATSASRSSERWLPRSTRARGSGISVRRYRGLARVGPSEPRPIQRPSKSVETGVAAPSDEAARPASVVGRAETAYADYQSFARAVAKRMAVALEGGAFPPGQRRLLEHTFSRRMMPPMALTAGGPLPLLYTTTRSLSTSIAQQGVVVGSCCQFYIGALDLLDDVQDRDLANTEHAGESDAIAINSGLALLALCERELDCVMRLEPAQERRRHWLSAHSRALLRAVGGQYRDLSPDPRSSTPEELLSTYADKTSTIGLVLEYGALLGGAPMGELVHYQRIGQLLGQAVQIVDDLSDIFGKPQSPDLSQGKLTFPLACFWRTATPSQRASMHEKLSREPILLGPVRDLLLESGAILECAGVLQRLRSQTMRVLPHGHGQVRFRHWLVGQFDRLVTLVGEGAGSGCVAPDTSNDADGFHRMVQETLTQLLERVAQFGPPPRPALKPWSESYFFYHPRTSSISYPDLPELGADALAFYAELLPGEAPEEVRALFVTLTPFALAHELFHHWRHYLGKLGPAAWHEEYVANRLAVGLMKTGSPEVVRTLREFTERVLAQQSPRALAACQARLHDCERPDTAPSGSSVSRQAATLVHLVMVRQLLEEPTCLAADLRKFL